MGTCVCVCVRYARLLQQILHNLLVESFPSGIVADAAAAVLHLLAAERDAYVHATSGTMKSMGCGAVSPFVRL